MSLAPITLDRFILEAQQVSPGATGALSLLLMRFGVAGKRIASALSRAGLTGTLGAAGSRNVQGEEQKKLDVVANEILVETFDYGKLVGLAASEEMEEPVVYAAGATGAGGYAVLFDPLDGSSNIDCNGTLGTIFSIRRRTDGGSADLLRSGHEQVAAGCSLRAGRASRLHHGRRRASLHAGPRDRRVPADARQPAHAGARRAYAVNEGRAHAWTPEVRAFVDHLKQPDGASGRPYATRYSASLVADVHRFLLEGGIYLYPADAAGKGASGKLRVLYECHPLAFVVEQAGGRASTGTHRVLDVVPDSLHADPLAIGSREEVELFEKFQSGGVARTT